MIDPEGASSGYYDISDVQQFILALNFLPYKNCKEPHLTIIKEEKLEKWFDKAEKASYLNDMKLSRYARPITQSQLEMEKMRRLGVIGDKEICTFAPSTKCDDEKVLKAD